MVDWADELAARVSGPQVVNDSKTPSGTVHVGSLRGPVILDVITRALRAAGHATTLLYGVDDLDAMDAQALLTPDAIERSMGVPLAHIPDQVGDGHASYARHHAQVFIDLFADLGVKPDRYYWMSDIYPTGAMDPFIRTALDRAQVVRDLYRRVSNVQHQDTWHPVLVICGTCGRVGTTIVTKWDGERVFYECRENLVTWAHGCGASGWVSPFGGAAKLPWNLEWAAQWSLFGVTIEPCGKDLATAGGSRDRSDAIAREVFEREPPINVPYEFLNVGGKKMSTSKGRGTAAHRIVEVLPPEPLRTLMIRTRPNTAIDFDPEGTDAVPRLFDEFDRLGSAVAGREVKGELPAGFASIFKYALRDPSADFEAEAAAFRPSFSHLAFLIQVPGADVPALMAAEKGSALTAHETAILDERLAAARVWLDDYAPERARMRVQESLPDAAAGLDAEQRAFLATLAEDGAARTGDEWQSAIFATATSGGLPAGRAFAALYAAFLGRTSGPRAGWLLASLDRAFVISRLREAAAGGTLPA
ncbi:MAG: lysyl-tRNA synthetase, class [Chloroflexota bacterium]|nr:lysyl-tRNA synthetase, class [Chloroflexota bacterium]